MKYLINERDWKGQYDSIPSGWKTFCGEEDIETGGDCFAQVFIKGKPKRKLSGQEVYHLRNKLLSEDVKGYELDVEDDRVVIEK
jgi:hypothetical protein